MADAHHAHDDSHSANYLAVFGALCVFTLISVAFDGFDLKGKTVFGIFNGTMLLIFLVLAVATAKALCVMAYFMHLKFERKWKYVLLAPTIILAVGLPMALLPDIGVPYYLRDTPQREQVYSGGSSIHESGTADESAEPQPQHQE